MASFTAGTTFVDGVSNDVTAAKLGALVTNATPTSGFIQDRTAETVIGTNDTILIGDASDSNNLKRMTVANILKAPLVSTSGTIDNLTTGTTTSTNEVVTNGTITNLSATTSTFLGTITGSTNVVNIGGGQIYKDSSGNVGIGISNPTSILHIKKSGAAFPSASNPQIRLDETSSGRFGLIEFDSSTNLNIWGSDAGSGSIRFFNGTGSGTERLRIDSSGNVGIGTASPASKLHVNGGMRVSGEVATAGASALAMDFLSGNSRLISCGSDASTQGGFSLISLNSTASIATERVRIDSSGNVGIGNTPSQKLDVNGASAIRGTLFLGDGSSSVIRKLTSSTPLTFANSGGSAEMTIDSSGNVGIGTAGPAVKLDVSNGNIQGKEILLQNGAASSPALGTTPSWYSPASGVAALSTDGAERLRIEATGTLKSQPTYDNTAAGSAVIVTSAGLIRRTSSSIKYKKDIENLYGSIVDNAILNLRPVWYRTKNPEGDDKSTWSHVGLIAEEVNSVEPRLVKYKTVEVSIGENGERIETQLENPIPEDVDYAKLSVILLSEVKAQKAKIASLEARLEALEAK